MKHYVSWVCRVKKENMSMFLDLFVKFIETNPKDIVDKFKVRFRGRNPNRQQFRALYKKVYCDVQSDLKPEHSTYFSVYFQPMKRCFEVDVNIISGKFREFILENVLN